TAQLNNLTKSGTLKGFELATDAQIVTATGRFGAALDQGRIAFTPAFFKAISTAQPFDLRSADDIPPNNMAFVLGHLAFHLQNAASMGDALAHLTANPNTTNIDKAVAVVTY